MSRLALHHLSRYTYDRPVALGPHVVRLRPTPHCPTPVDGYSLEVSPVRHMIRWQHDPCGNHVARILFPDPTHCLEISVQLVVRQTDVNPFDFLVEECARTVSVLVRRRPAARFATLPRCRQSGAAHVPVYVDHRPGAGGNRRLPDRTE